MTKLLLSLCFLLASNFCFTQTIYETINSKKMGGDRQLKIQLPRNYDKNSDKKYPILIVLDGDYLFEPVAGNVDYFSYWEDIPEMIVVGVNQSSSRDSDAYYDENTSLPSDTGASFFEFIGMELMTHLDSKYRTAPFRVIIGHDYTSNFINYYLLKENPLFQGYINLSPDLAPEMQGWIVNSLTKSETQKWFYLATATDDIPMLKTSILSFDNQLKNINNKNITYTFDNFNEANHYSLVGQAIPKALVTIFSTYGPISKKEYDSILLQTSVSSYDYLVEKYDNIQKLFALDMKVRVNDFMAIYNATEQTRNWEELKKLAKLAEKEYPKTMLSSFFEARYEEESGNPKKAMRSYQKAYGQEPIAFLTVEYMLDKAQDIKDDFGY